MMYVCIILFLKNYRSLAWHGVLNPVEVPDFTGDWHMQIRQALRKRIIATDKPY